MESIDKICYKSTFLAQVILRVDFAVPIKDAEIFHPAIITAIQKSYPKPEKEELVRFGNIEFEVAAGVPSQAQVKATFEGRQKTYLDSSMKNKLIIANNCLILEYNEYKSYEVLRESAMRITCEIYRHAQVLVSRIGLRYVNLFANSTSFKIQKSMFSRAVSVTMDTEPIGDVSPFEPIRSITTTEYKYGDIRVNFRSGVYNRLYPSRMTSDDFVIDIDCYMIGGISSSEELSIFLDTSHGVTQKMFENSITEKLRIAMDDQNE